MSDYKLQLRKEREWQVALQDVHRELGIGMPASLKNGARMAENRGEEEH